MFLQKALGFNPTTMKARTEIIAGATTFLTRCYILAVNPGILSTTGMDKGAVFTATAIASAIFLPSRSVRQCTIHGNNRWQSCWLKVFFSF